MRACVPRRRSAFVPLALRRRDIGARRNTHAGNGRCCVAGTVGLLRWRSGTGAPAAMARARGWLVVSWTGATCAAGRKFEADRRDASRAPVRGGRRFATSAAKRLGVCRQAWRGWVPAERSPALERHLAALSCFGTWPGSRSRYIPAAVKREVWRRDQGCCSYVDPYSGRRCGSRYRLEIDHIVPFALGGATELFNLRLRCRAHHSFAPRSCCLAHPASCRLKPCTPWFPRSAVERGADRRIA